MQYTSTYLSPFGTIVLASDADALTGLWFGRQKYFGLNLDEDHVEQETAPIVQAKAWLDQYFAGEVPSVPISLRFEGTPFQNEVWEILRTIPYGETVTYGAIAHQLAKKRGIARMAAQAVGGAVGHNPISIIVPCHRVVGSNGSLTGYAGGIEKKIQLLTLEGSLKDEFFVPKKGTAL